MYRFRLKAYRLAFGRTAYTRNKVFINRTRHGQSKRVLGDQSFVSRSTLLAKKGVYIFLILLFLANTTTPFLLITYSYISIPRAIRATRLPWLVSQLRQKFAPIWSIVPGNSRMRVCIRGEINNNHPENASEYAHK